MSVLDSIIKWVQGNIAHDAVDAGNPIKIGGKAFTAVQAAVANGDRVNAWWDEYGRLAIMLTDTSGNKAGIGTIAADGHGTGPGVYVVSFPQVWNGSGYDRQRVTYDRNAPGSTSPVCIDGSIYQASVTSPTDGQVAFTRMTDRRVKLSASDAWLSTIVNETPADTSEHAFSLPLEGARAFGLYINNLTGQNVTVKVLLYAGVSSSIVYQETIGNGVVRLLAPAPAGAGASANYQSIPAMGFPVMSNPQVTYTCAGAAGGAIRIDMGRLT